MGPAIAHDAQSKMFSIDGIGQADVQLVWDPPWNQNMISEAGRMKLGIFESFQFFQSDVMSWSVPSPANGVSASLVS